MMTPTRTMGRYKQTTTPTYSNQTQGALTGTASRPSRQPIAHHSIHHSPLHGRTSRLSMQGKRRAIRVKRASQFTMAPVRVFVLLLARGSVLSGSCKWASLGASASAVRSWGALPTVGLIFRSFSPCDVCGGFCSLLVRRNKRLIPLIASFSPLSLSFSSVAPCSPRACFLLPPIYFLCCVHADIGPVCVQKRWRLS